MLPMTLPHLAKLTATAADLYALLTPTPQLRWPLLEERCGCEVWVKHENHNPTGAFKVRGGLHYLSNLINRSPDIAGVCTATRGNHGQSIAYAAARFGLEAVIVVPEGNSPHKNRAMQAFGARLEVWGRDFDDAVLHARALAQRRDLHLMPSFHLDLAEGVASYSLELLRHVDDLDRVYVPIGLGSGICGMIMARAALDLDFEIVGVVAEAADCYLRSMEAGEAVSTESAETLADGLAVRNPNPEALGIMLDEVSRIVAVSESEILQAIRIYFEDTHNVAEGAGAAALAALIRERALNQDCRAAVVLSGGNIDVALFERALQTPL